MWASSTARISGWGMSVVACGFEEDSDSEDGAAGEPRVRRVGRSFR